MQRRLLAAWCQSRLQAQSLGDLVMLAIPLKQLRNRRRAIRRFQTLGNARVVKLHFGKPHVALIQFCIPPFKYIHMAVLARIKEPLGRVREWAAVPPMEHGAEQVHAAVAAGEIEVDPPHLRECRTHEVGGRHGSIVRQNDEE
ncbi:hypothetical protein BCR44DRAFT_1427239 [Catenaria anguillulae PL171]|uniref:Uncharacterized protein n=1 Tax=Catenaria anguillulae PL171 TaxID=765915 RepID=A0A1Y2HX88_9FUNG|nr:hypothetical protein BCR44DRAFT_1427239 [Catenaria anguillulae PL171]